MGAASFTFILLCFAVCLSYGSLSNEEQRIFGGHEVDIKDAPYVLAMFVDGKFKCGASIISEDYALTAAHCVIKIAANTTTISSGSPYRNGTVHNVDKIIPHEKYNEPIRFHNDIALIKVTPPFTFSNDTQPIGLPSQGQSDARSGTICGWGYYKKDFFGNVIKELSGTLRCTKVPLVNKFSCHLALPLAITNGMICYGNQWIGGVDTCQGDSGGSLVNDELLRGITSWGKGCANAIFPGVYTDVAKYIDWIFLIIGVNQTVHY